MKIYFCKANKINYFDLGYFYNFSGHLDIKKHYAKAAEICMKYGFKIEDMFEFEVTHSNWVKYHQIMYSSQDNQEPIVGAREVENFWNFIK